MDIFDLSLSASYDDLAMASSALPNFISSHVHTGRYFFLDLTPPSHVRLAVVCGGCETCDPDYRIERSNFPYFALEYVADGQGILSIDGVDYPLHPGSVFTYRPHIPHRFHTDPRNPMVKYFVDFVGRDALKLLRSADCAGPQPRQLLRTLWFQSLFDQLLETGQSAGDMAATHTALLLRTMISRLRIDSHSGQEAESTAYETYARCRRHAEQSYLILSSTTQWAEQCAIDRAYLSRLFNRYSNVTPYHFLVRLKIDHAVDAMVRQGMSIKQVAKQVGFDDPQHFSRVFKRTRGMSPSQFLQLVTRHGLTQTPRNPAGAASAEQI